MGTAASTRDPTLQATERIDWKNVHSEVRNNQLQHFRYCCRDFHADTIGISCDTVNDYVIARAVTRGFTRAERGSYFHDDTIWIPCDTAQHINETYCDAVSFS